MRRELFEIPKASQILNVWWCLNLVWLNFCLLWLTMNVSQYFTTLDRVILAGVPCKRNTKYIFWGQPYPELMRTAFQPNVLTDRFFLLLLESSSCIYHAHDTIPKGYVAPLISNVKSKCYQQEMGMSLKLETLNTIWKRLFSHCPNPFKT